MDHIDSSFTHSFKQYSLSTYCGPGPPLGARSTELNETEEMFFEDFAEFDDSEEFNEDTYADEAFDEALIEE